MSDHPAARASANAEAYRSLRILALTAVAAGVLLLAAAAFALSYAGIHAIAQQAGVSGRLARLYPLIFDAMLVVSGAAVLALRGAGLVTRCYAWLTLLVLLAAAAGADALHATSTRLPHRSAAATVAIIPWALVLLGFGLLLAMLRHARLRHSAAQASRLAHGPARAHWQGPAGSRPPSALPPGEMSGPAPRPAAAPVPVQAGAVVLPSAQPQTADHGGADDDPIRNGQSYRQDAGINPAEAASQPGDAAPAPAADTDLAEAASQPADASLTADTDLAAAASMPAGAGLDADTDLAVEADPGLDDPTSDEARGPGQPATPWVPRPRTEASAGYGDEYPAGTMSAAPTPDPDDDADPGPAVMPHFDRMQSSPTPPVPSGPPDS